MRVFSYFAYFFFILFAVTECYAASAPGTPQDLALIVTGLPGSHQFESYFRQSANTISAVLSENGFDENEKIRISAAEEDSEKWSRSMAINRENLEKLMHEISDTNIPYERFFLFLAGHANGLDEEAAFHIPGTDVNYATLMEWVDQIPAQQMFIVIAAPQGHIWVERLAKKERIIIAGNGMRQFDFIPMMFLRYFPRMFFIQAQRKMMTQQVEQSLNGAMVETTSAVPITVNLKDVFIETQKEIQNWYYSNNLHATELAVMDADGDGKAETLVTAVEPEPVKESESSTDPSVLTDKEKLLAKLNKENPNDQGVEQELQKLWMGELGNQEKKAQLPLRDGEAEKGPEEQIRTLNFTVDNDLPDAQAAATILFQVHGSETHGGRYRLV